MQKRCSSLDSNQMEMHVACIYARQWLPAVCLLSPIRFGRIWIAFKLRQVCGFMLDFAVHYFGRQNRWRNEGRVASTQHPLTLNIHISYCIRT